MRRRWLHSTYSLQTATEGVPGSASSHLQPERLIQNHKHRLNVLGRQQALSSQGPGVEMMRSPNDLRGTFRSLGAGAAKQEGRASRCPWESPCVTVVCENCHPGRPVWTRAPSSVPWAVLGKFSCTLPLISNSDPDNSASTIINYSSSICLLI